MIIFHLSSHLKGLQLLLHYPPPPTSCPLTNDFEFTGAPGVAIFVGGLTLPSSSIIWIDLVDDQSVHALDVLKIIVFGGLDSDVVMEPLNLRLRATGHWKSTPHVVKTLNSLVIGQVYSNSFAIVIDVTWVYNTWLTCDGQLHSLTDFLHLVNQGQRKSGWDIAVQKWCVIVMSVQSEK